MAQNLTIGRFNFRSNIMILETDDDIVEFETLLAKQPTYIAVQVVEDLNVQTQRALTPGDLAIRGASSTRKLGYKGQDSRALEPHEDPKQLQAKLDAQARELEELKKQLADRSTQEQSVAQNADGAAAASKEDPAKGAAEIQQPTTAQQTTKPALNLTGSKPK